jgi:coenzyme F420-0:L-glutamate ligase / coenzyme F420-1:gamma-L-glutamate ligase
VSVQLIPVEGLPEVQAGHDLAQLIVERVQLDDGDVVVVAQKVVSKEEGRRRELATVQPGERARQLAAQLGRDARFIQLVLDETRRVVRAERVLIVETRQGFVCANAGVDASNTGAPGTVTLLPLDCDASAARLRDRIDTLGRRSVGVIVSDTFGRPWRLGICNVALGVAGLPALIDERGNDDDDGRTMLATVVAFADEVAAAAGLVMRKTARIPVVVVRGLEVRAAGGRGADLVRPAEEDLFR